MNLRSTDGAVARAPRRGGWHCLRGIVLLAVIATLLSCGEDKLPVLPPDAGMTGGIAGVIRVAGRGAPLGLKADGLGTHVSVAFRPDSTGHFSVPLPEGNYIVRLSDQEVGRYYYSSHGLVTLYEDADTLRVRKDGAAPYLEMDLSRIDLHLGWPDWWEPGSMSVVVRGPIGPPGSYLETGWYGEITATGDSAQASLGPLLEGAYLIGLQARNEDEPFWLPGVAAMSEAETISVGHAAVTRHECRLGLHRRTVRGSLLGAWQVLNAGRPTVGLWNSEANRIAASDVADDGSFRLSVVAAEEVRLEIDNSGIYRWLGGRTFDEAEMILLPDSGEVVLPTIRDRGIQVTLTVEPPADVYGFRWTVEDLSGFRLGYGSRYSFASPLDLSGLTPGDYRFQVEPTSFGQYNWVGQWYDGANSASQATTIHIAEEDEVVPIAMTLHAGGTIRGRIVCEEPGTYVHYSLVPADSTRCLGMGAQSLPDDGTVELLGIPPGRYKLAFGWMGHTCADPTDDNWVWYGPNGDWNSATVITMEEQGTVEGIEVTLPPYPYDVPIEY